MKPVTKPLTLIIRTAGTNCDLEMAHAFELAGARTTLVHLNELIRTPKLLETIDLLGFPGGFSFGDDIASGRIFATRLRLNLLGPLQAAIKRGVPAIGVCNGFQVITKLGLLPDPFANRQTATLSENTSGRFTDKWVSLDSPADSVCIWTRGIVGTNETFDLPIAHGEGRFVPADDAVLQSLKANRQIALRYSSATSATFPGNPNGSVDDIAGICDPTGLVLGLMPHPERFTNATNHPLWTRRGSDWLTQTPAGLKFFINAVEHVKAHPPAAVGESSTAASPAVAVG